MALTTGTIVMISIHAPTKGATDQFDLGTGVFPFQSTLPRRERLADLLSQSANADFNPRSHEGSDGQLDEDAAGNLQFQSTLPRRERRSRGMIH